MKIAVIDIGSNSIRYMEAEKTDSGFSFSKKETYTTRLAEGLSATGLLSDQSVEKSLSVLTRLSARAREKNLPCFCYATSAVRDAANRDEFVRKITEQAALPVDILPGEEEAALAYAGAGKNGGLIDIGGGSSQIITESFRASFPIGAVRIRDWCPSQTLSDLDALIPLFDRTYDLPPFSETEWTAVGGTATTLGALSLNLERYDPDRVGGVVLYDEALMLLLRVLESLGDSGRSEIPLLARRHNIIMGGGYLLHYLMNRIGIRSLRISDVDGLEGYAVRKLEDIASADQGE